MAIKDRNLIAGTELAAKYKGTSYSCKVKDSEDGLVSVLEDERQFNSLSSAGSAVMNGNAVNGWRFWSVVDEESDESNAALSEASRERSKKLLYRLPNQKGVGGGKSRWFCNACMSSFLADAGQTPRACPEGHSPQLAG